jgi:hypothetical protein
MHQFGDRLVNLHSIIWLLILWGCGVAILHAHLGKFVGDFLVHVILDTVEDALDLQIGSKVRGNILLTSILCKRKHFQTDRLGCHLEADCMVAGCYLPCLPAWASIGSQCISHHMPCFSVGCPLLDRLANTHMENGFRGKKAGRVSSSGLKVGGS